LAGEVFDRVVRRLATGQLQTMSKKEFESMALSERVKAILGKELKFYCGVVEVPAKVALSER